MIEILWNAPSLIEAQRNSLASFIRYNLEDRPFFRFPPSIQVTERPASEGLRLRLEATFEDLKIAQTGSGPDPETAVRQALEELLAKVDRHKDYLAAYKDRVPVMELNFLSRGSDGKVVRHFIRKRTEEQARIEIELSEEPARIFYNEEKCRVFLVLNHGQGETEVLEPGHSHTAGAGIETALTQSVRERLERMEKTASGKTAGKGDPDKYARIRPFLRCPTCLSEVVDEAGFLLCESCQHRFPVLAHIPIMTVDPNYDGSPTDSPVSENTYGQQALNLISKHKDGLVLDCGSGCPPATFKNVIHLEIVRYPGVDIVAKGEHLPFADGTFDAAISESVLEHVRDPFGYADELYRVIKPGGEIRVDAPFLHPYHGYPHHYFNMTFSGLELLLKRFDPIDVGCGPHQQPYVMLVRVLHDILAGIPAEEDRARVRRMTVEEILTLMETQSEKGPFQTMTREAVFTLAAGFYFYGVKP